MGGTHEEVVPRDGQVVAVVHDRLRAAILSGEIPAGQATSQNALARDFGAGRTPVREALRMLQREGLVLSEPNRRVRIADLSASDAEELYLMRIALEAGAPQHTAPAVPGARTPRGGGRHGARGVSMRPPRKDRRRAAPGGGPARPARGP